MVFATSRTAVEAPVQSGRPLQVLWWNTHLARPHDRGNCTPPMTLSRGGRHQDSMVRADHAGGEKSEKQPKARKYSLQHLAMDTRNSARMVKFGTSRLVSGV